MNTDIKLPVILVFSVLATGILFMICAWVRFVRIEDKLTEHETKIYVLDLVQNELLDSQGLHIEVRGAESAVGDWHSTTSEMTHITVSDQDSDEEPEKRPARNKRRSGD